MDRAQPLLHTEALTVTIGATRVCTGLDLALAPGQCWALLGRNGAGKTTLLHTLAGLRAPQAGGVRIEGRPLLTISRRERARRIGLLPQDTDDPFPATVLETVLIGRHPHLRPWRFERAEDFAQAQAALETVGLAPLQQRQVSTLSGGERRRLAVATLLCQQPAVMLLDEPTNHLDLHYQVNLLAMLATRVSRTGAALLSLHDVNLATRFCSHGLLLYGNGAFAHGPIEEVVNCANLQRLYHHDMIETETDTGKIYLPA